MTAAAAWRACLAKCMCPTVRLWETLAGWYRILFSVMTIHSQPKRSECSLNELHYIILACLHFNGPCSSKKTKTHLCNFETVFFPPLSVKPTVKIWLWIKYVGMEKVPKEMNRNKICFNKKKTLVPLCLWISYDRIIILVFRDALYVEPAFPTSSLLLYSVRPKHMFITEFHFFCWNVLFKLHKQVCLSGSLFNKAIMLTFVVFSPCSIGTLMFLNSN